MSSNPLFTFMSDTISSAYKWIEDMPTVEWLKENVYLSGEVSPNPGYMTFDNYPWAEQIINDADKDHIETLVIMASTQTSKTTITFGILAKMLDDGSTMIILAIPTDDGVGDFNSSKLDPFLNGIKTLKKKIKNFAQEEKARLKGATKRVSGAILFILGNTPKNRRSKTAQGLFIDEAALFDKGHIEEWIGRTKSFEDKGRKIVISSSIMASDDEIVVQHNKTYCKKELMVQCPSCDNTFYPTSKHFYYMTQAEYKKLYDLEKIDNITPYKREATKTACIVCDCGYKIDDKEIRSLIRRKKVNMVIVDGLESDISYGYKLNALCTGITKYSTMADALIDAGDDEDVLSTIYRDYFNEVYEKSSKVVLSNDIHLLGNGLEEFIIPKDTIGLYMGVDSQKDHYWVVIKAVTYMLNTHVVWCGRVEDLSSIEEFMDRRWYYEDGKQYTQGIRRTFQDWQGYRETNEVISDETGEITYERTIDIPQQVKEFAYKMSEKYGLDKEEKERFYATRGESFLSNDALYNFVNTQIEVGRKKTARKLKTIKMGVVGLKSIFMSSVVRSVAKAKAQEGDEAYEFEGRMHFINQTLADSLANRTKILDTDYDRQITSQIFTYGKSPNGKRHTYKSWVDVTKHDHFLDCNVEAHIGILMDNLASVQKPTDAPVSSIKSMIGKMCK